MANGLLERLRGARGIELFAALAVAATLALLLVRGSVAPDRAQKTELEMRLEGILSRVDGTGRVDAMIAQDADGNVTGVLIVAEGLSDVRTYLHLQAAVRALLEVQPDRIEIISSSREFGGDQWDG